MLHFSPLFCVFLVCLLSRVTPFLLRSVVDSSCSSPPHWREKTKRTRRNPVEHILRPLAIGLLLGWRPLLLTRLEAIALRLEAIEHILRPRQSPAAPAPADCCRLPPPVGLGPGHVWRRTAAKRHRTLRQWCRVVAVEKQTCK